MRITVLGSASGLPVPHRNASAYSVEAGGNLYLIDAGEGVSRQLLRYGIDCNRISSIFISHTHSDHVSGLFMLLQMMQLTGRKSLLRIYLPQGVANHFQSVFSCFQIFQENWPFKFKIEPISPGPFMDENGFHIEAVSNGHLQGNNTIAEKHGIGTDSYSFYFHENQNGSVLFTSDVDSLEHLNFYKETIKIIIVEATHIEISNIIQFALNKHIPHIILTHIPMKIEENPLNIGPLPESTSLEIASDGLMIEV
jgi:ribonuclease BN (tRNA processing enzyme)